MQNYDHKKIIDTITQLDTPPSEAKAFAEWIKADAHIAFLRDNANSDEVVVYASGEYTFVHSLIVPNERLSPPDQDDLLSWNCNAYTSISSYVSGGGKEGVWLERGLTGTGTETLEGALQPVFARAFEGWRGPGRNYLERFNGDGDLESIVSVTNREDKGGSMSLVTFNWEPLEEYLVASNSSLVRMFDFTLFRKTGKTGFSGWSDRPEQKIQETNDFFYRRKVDGPHAAYTRGVQIVRSRRSMEAVRKDVVDGWFGNKSKQYAEFIAWDWRNKRLAKISTDPSASTNYFVAKDNQLPYELSPAFFRPEVLSKYKTDREKYTVGERDVSCRAAWHLKGIDVNDAGQVHAYIVYLRDLPYSEQLHWLSFNEEPKTGIAQRAATTDFKGEFSDLPNPLGKLLSIVQRWDHDKVPWWTLRDDNLIDRVNIPLTSSRDEWAESFMDLAKLVVEGFETKAIRERLDQSNVPYTQDEKSIALLEKLLNKDGKSTDRLTGLRLVQHLRSKAKGLVGGSDADELAQSALTEHATFANHFKYVCQLVSVDLETIEKLFL